MLLNRCGDMMWNRLLIRILVTRHCSQEGASQVTAIDHGVDTSTASGRNSGWREHFETHHHIHGIFPRFSTNNYKDSLHLSSYKKERFPILPMFL